MIRVALYGRVSTGRNRREVHNQLTELREFAERHGWLIIDEFIDDSNGRNEDRAKFRRMLANASQGLFDVVLFWSLDQFRHRGTLDGLDHLHELSDYGVGFDSFTEAYLDSSGTLKNAVIAIRSIAKQEPCKICESRLAESKQGKEKGTRAGKPLGRPRAVFDRDLALELRKRGLSWPQVASKLSVGVTTVKRACRAASAVCQNPDERNLRRTPAENQQSPAPIPPTPMPGPVKKSV